MPETTFTGPDLTTFLGLDALGLTAVGQYLTAERAVSECRMPIGFDLSCTGWGGLCFRVGFFVGILGVRWSFRGTKAAVGSGG